MPSDQSNVPAPGDPDFRIPREAVNPGVAAVLRARRCPPAPLLYFSRETARLADLVVLLRLKGAPIASAAAESIGDSLTTTLREAIPPVERSDHVLTSMPLRADAVTEHALTTLVGSVADRTGIPSVNDRFRETRPRPDISDAVDGKSRAAAERAIAGNARFEGRLDGKTVILVDDVLHRGASIRRATAALRAAGAADVIPIALVHLANEREWTRGAIRRRFHPDYDPLLELRTLGPSLRRLIAELALESFSGSRAATSTRACRLFSTDVDGTLYEGPRRTARVPHDLVRVVARWLAEGGHFHVLTSGTMAGLVRDRLDLVGPLAHELRRLDERNVAGLLQARMSFSTANGIESYAVVDPFAPQASDRVRFEGDDALLASRAEVLSICRRLELRYGLKLLVCDSPVAPDRDQLVAAAFLRLDAPVDRARAEQLERDANDWMRSEGADLRLQAVWRSDPRTRRFDLLPAAQGRIPRKSDAARELFSRFASVLYTGDQPESNDRDVFALARELESVEACEVAGPSDVVRRLEEALRAPATLPAGRIGRTLADTDRGGSTDGAPRSLPPPPGASRRSWARPGSLPGCRPPRSPRAPREGAGERRG